MFIVDNGMAVSNKKLYGWSDGRLGGATTVYEGQR